MARGIGGKGGRVGGGQVVRVMECDVLVVALRRCVTSSYICHIIIHMSHHHTYVDVLVVALRRWDVLYSFFYTVNFSIFSFFYTVFFYTVFIQW